jgi:hypothetical protein
MHKKNKPENSRSELPILASRDFKVNWPEWKGGCVFGMIWQTEWA